MIEKSTFSPISSSGSGSRKTLTNRPATPTVPKFQSSETGQLLLNEYPALVQTIEVALTKLSEYVPENFSATVDRFCDPYDGSVLLTVAVDSNLGHALIGKALDDFYNDWWFEYMDSTPIEILFRAGN